jgi:prepilin-type N-terminal cleavage/methylation domain-containing protein
MGKAKRGFTVIELLVVIAIITILVSIMAPALSQVRSNARQMLSMNNKRTVVMGVTNYALDHHERYPESVATIGLEQTYWNWQEPTLITGLYKRAPHLNRSMSSYLKRYIQEADTVYCPSAPSKFRYWDEAWEAGENWDNPETVSLTDPVVGTFCFYWGYVGYLEDRDEPFRGPTSLMGNPGQSNMLVSDYFGYNHWRSQNSFGSCEKLPDADVTAETWISAPYWSESTESEEYLQSLALKLHAGYVDGHVETYHPTETIPMKVSITADGSVPYPDGVGPGEFFLPFNSVYQ